MTRKVPPSAAREASGSAQMPSSCASTVHGPHKDLFASPFWPPSGCRDNEETAMSCRPISSRKVHHVGAIHPRPRSVKCAACPNCYAKCAMSKPPRYLIRQGPAARVTPPFSVVSHTPLDALAARGRWFFGESCVSDWTGDPGTPRPAQSEPPMRPRIEVLPSPAPVLPVHLRCR